MSKIQLTCKCGTVYFAREVDLKRGWGKSCSKSCAAIKRAKSERSGNHKCAKASKIYSHRVTSDITTTREWDEAQLANEAGWDAHKSW